MYNYTAYLNILFLFCSVSAIVSIYSTRKTYCFDLVYNQFSQPRVHNYIIFSISYLTGLNTKPYQLCKPYRPMSVDLEYKQFSLLRENCITSS